MEERNGERGLQIFLENLGDFQIFHHIKGGIMFGATAKTELVDSRCGKTEVGTSRRL